VDGGFRVLGWADLYRLVVGGNKTVHLYVHTQSRAVRCAGFG
jgi:hypothetical protein